ncbi:MAG TPA: hypothetical protein PK696_11110 [bacterium]|nr:hypothetical protein [bacterium]HQM52458.1 hypothetical protein [bacterium]
MRLKAEYAYIAIFALLSLLMLFNHEAWRDEAQGWLIARDSPSFLSVVRQMGREGTPGLWFYLAYPLAKSGLPFRAGQFANFLVILCAAVVFIRCAPFPLHQRALFILGYYMLYEYSVITRTYGLSVLCILAAAALYKDRFTRPVAYSVPILLLANTNVHGIILAAVLAGAYLFESIASGGRRAGGARAALLVMALGLALAMCQTISREARADQWVRWHWELSHVKIRELLYAVQLAFLPVSGPGVNFWGSVLVRYPACVFVAVPLAAASVAALWGRRIPLAIYLCSAIGLLGLFWLKYPGARRHIGFIYISWIFSLWAAECRQDAPPAGRFPTPGMRARLVTTLLFLQLAGSAQAVYYELRYDFSPAKRVAGYLEEHGHLGDEVFIAAFPSTKAQAVALYLPKPHSRIFQVECERFGSYTAHTKEFMRDQAALRIEDVVRRVDKGIGGGTYRAAVLILNERMEGNEDFIRRYEPIASFEEHIAEDEPMYLYRMRSPIRGVGGASDGG